MTEISVFIPVYRESEQLFGMLDKLTSQNVDKEIIVTVDEPTEDFIEKAKEFGDVKFLFNEKRIGKVNALNEATKVSTGRVLLFLDSDVEVADDPDFLKKIIEKMKYVDILDIKKKVNRDSFLSKMAYYEYLSFNASAWLASRYLKKCPAVNGAAFAIRKEMFESVEGFRKVVAEDIDIATRAFLRGSRFAYAKEVEVKNHVYSNWKSWFTQRRRWAIGQWLWAKDHYKELARVCIKKPQVVVPGLFFLYPSAMVLLLNVAVPTAWLAQSLWIFSFLLSIKFTIGLPVFLVSITMFDLFKSVLISLASFGITAALFFGFSRKLGFEIKLHELFVYYFFYSILWIAIGTIGFIQVVVLRKKVAPDWKT